MKRIAVLAALLGGPVAVLSAQSPKFTKVVWPKRIAVGMLQTEQLPPLTVEATPTGWVSISLLSTRPDGGLQPPYMRMLTDARDLKRWISRVRPMLADIQDTTKAVKLRSPITLGNGAFEIQVSPGYGSNRNAIFSWRACGPGWGSASPAVGEVLELVALLDSAAKIAGGREGSPPTLSRPYYSGEITCPVRPDTSNELPSADGDSSPPALGVAFVVDTAGRVEARSIRMLPSADAQPGLERAARASVERWRFRPAEIDGTPVRQLVQMPVSFKSEHGTPPPLTPEITLLPTDDGWVQLRQLGGPNNIIQEWFDPDSVDVWVERVRALNREAASLPPDSNMLRQRTTSLGHVDGIRFTSGFLRHGKALDWVGGLTECAGAGTAGGKPVGDAAAFAEAARQARLRRRPPVEPGSGVFSVGDVACPAWFPWVRYTRQGFRRVWRYPVGLYPASMRPSNARAEVLVSFVVDTTGAAEMNTLRVIPGADPRAVAVIPATLMTLRFRPATRAGRKVRQRVIQTIRFEPPPVCASPDDSPACPRRYSDH